MRLLLRRHGDGIGDWLFMLQAMKHLNLYVPKLRLDVCFELERRRNMQRRVPELVPEAYGASDVDWTAMHEDTCPDVVIPHVVYPIHSGGPYVDGMLDQICKAIDVERSKVPFDPELLPEYNAGPRDAAPLYVGMVSQSKRETAFKNWGIERFERLATRVFREQKLGVLQIGASSDYELQGVPYHRALGCNFATLVYWLRRCHVVVTLENGIAVLCGHLRIPHIVILPNSRNLGRYYSASSLVLVSPSVDEVFNAIKEKLL